MVAKAFPRHKRYAKRLLEVYTRHDISCGSDLCTRGCSVQDGIRSDVHRYVFPNTECIERYLDCFEQSSFDEDGVILLRSQLNRIGTGKLRLLTRIRSLYRDKRRNVFMFDDVHHADLQQDSESPDDDSSMVARAACWYEKHLSGRDVEYVVLDSPTSIHDYFVERWKEDDTILNLYESQRVFVQNVSARRSSSSALDGSDIELGIAQGRYVRGILQVDAINREKACILGDVDGVYVIGKEDRWHAIHGDSVVAALYSEEADVDTRHEGEIEEGEMGLLGDASEDFSQLDEKKMRWKARVIFIPEHNQRPDILVSISVKDEEAVKGQHQSVSSSVLCIPFDRRFPMMRLRSRNLEKYTGKRLLVRIIAWEEDSMYPEVHVLKVLGSAGDLETEKKCILHRHEVDFEDFSKAVLAELPTCDSKGYKIPSSEIEREIAAGRADLRSNFVVSIDPPGCTDVDDAFHIKSIDESSFELGIHIADVTYYVKMGSLLDEEAAHRSTTVYLVDQRLNMLPSILSEDAASLLCGKSRFAVSVIWKVSRKSFEILDEWFGRSIIQSRYQLEYSQAQAILNGSNDPSQCGTTTREDIKQLRISLELVRALAWRRLKLRLSGGAIELDSKEIQFEIDEKGAPCCLHNKSSIDSMKIVAELMIMANEAVANRISDAYPSAALLRSHAIPTREKLFQMHNFVDNVRKFCALEDLKEYDLFINPENFGKDLQKLFERIPKNKYGSWKSLLQMVANRSLSEARYVTAGSVSNHRHFGLSIDQYTHFTSPIRRYADIIVHRQLLDAIGSTDYGQEPLATLQSKVETMNQRNREAKLAQRECSLLYLLEYLSKHPQHERAIVQTVDATVIHVYVPRLELKGRIPIGSDNTDVKPFDTVWVLLKAHVSSYHGPCLEVSRVSGPDETNSEEDKSPLGEVPSLLGRSDQQQKPEGDTDVVQTPTLKETEAIESLTSLLRTLAISKETWARKTTKENLPRSYILQGRLGTSMHPLESETYEKLLKAMQVLLQKSRVYTQRAARFPQGSDKNVYWMELATQAATHAHRVNASIYNLK